MKSKRVNKKPCKGIGKASGYPGCGKLIQVHERGLCDQCFRSWLISTDEGRATIPEIAKKAAKQVAEEKKEKFKKMKQSATNYKLKLQTKVQEIARLIDHKQPCLARQTMGQMQGGHVYSKGANPQMRFNLHNMHRQSARSNKWLNDDGKMKEGIIREYGQEYMNFLDQLKKAEVPKLQQIHYRQAYKRACTFARTLKEMKKEYDEVDRIRWRNMANVAVDIYKKDQSVFKFGKKY